MVIKFRLSDRVKWFPLLFFPLFAAGARNKEEGTRTLTLRAESLGGEE